MQDTAALAQALDQLLEPLVEVLLRGGMPHKAFAELAKGVYVRVAEGEGGVAGRKQSTSRIAVRTGLTRKDVRRLRIGSVPPSAASSERYSRASRVVTGWLRDERFLEGGQPAVLPFDGVEPSFAMLVKGFSGDVPPRAMLDELLSAGTVSVDEEGQVRLVERGYLPRRGEADKLQILGSDVAGLISTIRRNLDAGPEDAWYQRKVFGDNLSVPALAALRRLTAETAQAFLEHIAVWMAEHDLDEHPELEGPGGGRAGIGIYYFEEPSEEGSA
ncbi:MAG: DUF6502 family protein [Planctomycetota bacterium]|nr:DUF6502 family protein [Planctomycetota bacterium]